MKLAKPKITPRMKTFLGKALPQRPFWDICCDHGYVSYAAIVSNEFTEIHCVDQIPHIIDRLKILLDQRFSGIPENVYCYPMSGENLESEVSGNCLIAGVGGLTIKNILSALLIKEFLKADRLLLSPHTDEKTMLAFVESKEFTRCYNFIEKIIMVEGPRSKPLYVFDRLSNSVNDSIRL